MKNISKFSVLLSMLLMLNGCSHNENEVLPEETIENSNTIEITETTQVTETIGVSNDDIVDVTSYINTLSNDEINDNPSIYLYDIDFYTNACDFIIDGDCKEDIEYGQFRMQCINKKYPLNLSTNYPIVDEYYKMIDTEAKQTLDTLYYVDGVPTFTYVPYPNHDEIEQQFQDFMYDYYNVTDEKIQELNYPFDKISVNNDIPKDLVDLENECVEKYTYHYNGLRCLRYIAVKFAIWGEDVPNDKNSTARTCYEILCRMKDFTQEYNTVMGENPQDVDIVNEYIEKYSQAYMYILQNKDTLTDDEAYTYLHNFLFDEDMIDLQTQVYHITTENLDTFLNPID